MGGWVTTMGEAPTCGAAAVAAGAWPVGAACIALIVCSHHHGRVSCCRFGLICFAVGFAVDSGDAASGETVVALLHRGQSGGGGRSGSVWGVRR